MEQEDNDALEQFVSGTPYITQDGRKIIDFGNLLLIHEPAAKELAEGMKRRWRTIAGAMTHEQLISAFVSLQADYAVTGALYSKACADATEAERRVRVLEKENALQRPETSEPVYSYTYSCVKATFARKYRTPDPC